MTTKTNRTDQRGRFGIGLKTLKRIADDLAIHPAPYHFSGDQLSVQVVPAEGPLPGFYDPATDTMIVLRLKTDFSEEGLEAWFAEWEDDGLIFLTWVSSFRWCDPIGATLQGRTLSVGVWENIALVGGRDSIIELSRREVESTATSWTVWRATLRVPGYLHPAHKARADVTRISVAVPSAAGAGSLYIGFKTRVAVDLSFSLDAQFDPSTTREALIESTWNNWLIERCGDVLGEIAHGRTRPLPQHSSPSAFDLRFRSGNAAEAGISTTRAWRAQDTTAPTPAGRRRWCSCQVFRRSPLSGGPQCSSCRGVRR